MSLPKRTPSDASMDSSEGNIRKRVCKACDRCRLKKSKCDGASPCSRCKADNAICVFGERKKLHDKVYPKGYVEMLEQQQTQLVSGLRELYRRLQAGESWPGAPLAEASNGHPLTHDVLDRLDLLYANGDHGSPTEPFEDDFSKMQQRLLDNGATYMHRRGSVSSDSDHDHSHPSPPNSASTLGTPPSSRLPYPEAQLAAPPTPPMENNFFQQMPLKNSPALALPGGTAGLIKPEANMADAMRSQWAIQAPSLDDATMMDYMSQFDASMNYDTPMFDQYPPVNTTEWVDPSEMVLKSDMDFNNFIDQVAA